MNTVMLMPETQSHQQQLNDELREFADIMPVTVYHPSIDEAIAAIQPHCPEWVVGVSSAQQLLDRAGLVVINDIGQGYEPMRFSWSVADSTDAAEEQLRTYMKPQYQSIRKTFGIDHHWVVLVTPGFWGYDSDEILNGHISFEFVSGKPECWLFNLSGKS